MLMCMYVPVLIMLHIHSLDCHYLLQGLYLLCIFACEWNVTKINSCVYFNLTGKKQTKKPFFVSLYILTCPRLNGGNISQLWVLSKGDLMLTFPGPHHRSVKKKKNMAVPL